MGLGYPADGLALFYRTPRLSALGAPRSAFFAGVDGAPLSQCFVLAQLHDTAVGRPLVLVTTHLKAKAGAACDAVRLVEAQQARVGATSTCLCLVHVCARALTPVFVLCVRSCLWSLMLRSRGRRAARRCCAATSTRCASRPRCGR